MNEVVRIPLASVPDPEPIVRLNRFSRSFGATRVLDALDLAIAPGEFVALLGRSGSGKTTLLRTLAGLEAGAVDAVSPSIGDFHKVANAYADRVSVSIHVYGADIGAVERSTYDENGRPKRFVSGYADAPVLDLARGAA